MTYQSDTPKENGKLSRKNIKKKTKREK